MMLILTAMKQTLQAERSVRFGDWSWRNLLQAREVSGKNLPSIGYGRIGRHLARLAGAFGMQVRACASFFADTGWPGGRVRVEPVADLLEGLGWADAVSINVPRADRPLIGERAFAAMRRNAVLVNTARGEIVDGEALPAAITSGTIAGAGLDVLDGEPPATTSPLKALAKVALTPRIASLTAESAERMAACPVQNVLDFYNGKIGPDLVVDRDQMSPRSPDVRGCFHSRRAVARRSASLRRPFLGFRVASRWGCGAPFLSAVSPRARPIAPAQCTSARPASAKRCTHARAR